MSEPVAPAEDENAPYHYLVVRSDIPIEKLLVNLGHAAGESIVQAPISKLTRLIYLYVTSEAELLEYADKARAKGFEVALVNEPDPPFNGAAVSFGLAPSTRRNQLRKLFYHLRTVDRQLLADMLARDSSTPQ